MMNKNFIIKSGLVIVLFSIAIYEDNRVISFIFFTLPWFIILYPFFFKKQIRNEELFSEKNKKNKSPIRNLFFKSNKDAFEYTQKYFTNYKLETKSVYHGICLTPYLVQIHCLDNNNNNILTPIVVEKSKDLKKEILVGDFVLVGIEEVKELITSEKLKKLGITSEKKDYESKLKKKVLRDSSKGVILKKLTLELDIKSHQFVFDE